MWLITGTIEPQMSRNVADSGLYMYILPCLLIALLYITCVTCLTNSFCWIVCWQHNLTFILGTALGSEDIFHRKPPAKKFQHVEMWFLISSEWDRWNQGFQKFSSFCCLVFYFAWYSYNELQHMYNKPWTGPTHTDRTTHLVYKRCKFQGIASTARQCTVCSLVYCTHTNRYSSALDTWAVFHTSRMRRLYTSQNEHFAYTYDIAVCIWIRYIRHHLSAYFRWTRADSVHVMYSNRFKSIFCSAYLKASA